MCADTQVAVATLQAIFGQLSRGSTGTPPVNPTTIDGSLLLTYFNTLLMLIQRGCDVQAPPFVLPTTTYVLNSYALPGGCGRLGAEVVEEAEEISELENLINNINDL